VRTASVLIALTLLSACAVPYDKPGVSEEEKQRDYRACTTEAESRTVDSVNPTNIGSLRRDCMERRGYR
jgi:hypothetical protein